MTKPLLVALLLAAATTAAQAETKLTATVYTASPNGFLVNSTLVAGDKEAILVDAQFDLADAHRLVAMILESKKTLTAVYVTHFHPDHYFGLVAIKQAFPNAKLVALPAARGTGGARSADWLAPWPWRSSSGHRRQGRSGNRRCR